MHALGLHMQGSKGKPKIFSVVQFFYLLVLFNSILQCPCIVLSCSSSMETGALLLNGSAVNLFVCNVMYDVQIKG